MSAVAFNCDRCGKRALVVCLVSTGTWSKYGQDGEHLVCDGCIQSMPAYQADYGLPAVAPRGR